MICARACLATPGQRVLKKPWAKTLVFPRVFLFSIASLGFTLGRMNAFWLLLLLLSSAHVFSQEPGTISPSGKYSPGAAPSATNAISAAAAMEVLKGALNVQQTGTDTFAIGQVTFDKKTRQIKFPARINMRSEVIEYALVSDMGKKHEAILATAVKPLQLHLACLLLGITATNLSGEFNHPCPVPAANAVQVEIAWNRDGTKKREPLASLVVIKETSSPQSPQPLEKPLAAGNWFYNGSFFGPSAFQAQAEGSFISLIRDSAALINNPRADLDNDKIHYPNTALLPPEGTPVEVILQLPP